jgi:hypothetical protein
MILFIIAALLQASPAEVFERRLKPIFASPNPSSCMDCHFAGVDLKNYLHPSHEKSFLSLRDQGMIDLDKPESSRILKLISMGESEGAKLVGAEARKQEYAAFLEWIRASAADPALRSAPKLAPAEFAKPPRPNEVIRHARKDALLASFERTVWSQRFRCTSCHMAGGAENAKLVEKHGAGVTWIKGDAAGTLDGILGGELVDRAKPEKSLLLTKPANQVKHGGGQKMLVGDQGYKAFRDWLEDAARTLRDGYAKASELPPARTGPLSFGTEIWLKLDKTPDAWGEKLLQVAVHAWDPKSKSWEKDPIATSDRKVWGKGKLWQHNLLLLAATGSERAKTFETKPALPQGRYKIIVQVDAAGRLEKDWKASLGKADVAGEWELESAWPAGYGRMTAVDVSRK